MTDATRRAAEFIINRQAADLSTAATQTIKLAILDTIGVIVAATRAPEGRIVADHVLRVGGTPVASLFGIGAAVSPQDAALANGVAAHALDFDDMHTGACGHASAVLVPAILALGEMLDAPGIELLAAYSAGFELVYAIGQEIGMAMIGQGHHPTAIWAPLGSAAAAARLLRLDGTRTQMALGMAATHAGGLVANFGSMTKPYHAGAGAAAGVQCALLARDGFTAAPDILENPRGLLAVLAPEARADADRLVARMGATEALAEGMEFKFYPSCGKTHASIESALALATEHDLNADDVVEIECHAARDVPGKSLIHHQPQNGLQARFSMEYGVAAALLDRAAGLSQFTDGAVLRPAAQDLMRRFRYVFSEAMQGPDGYMSAETLVLRLRDGRELRHRCARAPGVLGGGADRHQIHAKFEDCAAGVLPAADVRRLVEMTAGFAALPGVARYCRLARGTAGTGDEALVAA